MRWHDIQTLWEIILNHNASTLEFDPYGLKPEDEGSLAVFDATDIHNTFRTRSCRRLIVRDGRCVVCRETDAS